ncbi:uncharacterized protein RSE6_07330 [Rhynchosporium secalis]|uniref:CPAF-like PDZ domain-containing protein n=1 Tax=Rhynchosporium secalis TaxID=38038 RepID=A0A1E1MCJ5_RHYSE|nr:uncharacterized protein RSE6_07330 [Rhynchosporium secalis]
MLGLSLVVIAALSPLAFAHPSPLNDRATSGPCGEIRNRVKAAFAADPGARPLLPAQLGYDCLTSVPLHKAEALAFVDSYSQYIGWQSTLGDAKSPPSNYGYAAIDVVQQVSQVRQKLQADQYHNEYSYMMDLHKIVVSAHDNLFIFRPDILSSALHFIRPESLTLVSVSPGDGCDLPKIYLKDDLQANPKSSAVSLINGLPAEKYIDTLITQASGFPDRDAAYNSQMWSIATDALAGTAGEFQGYGTNTLIFAGPTTTIKFENGTSKTWENQARVRESFEGVTDGESFYQRYCTDQELNYTSSILAPTAPPRRHAYPVQIGDSHGENSIAGYYLNTPGYTDIAVLSVLDFFSNSVTAFQSVAEEFIAKAKADKKKIIIDLSSCEGGQYFPAYDLFKQFFPHLNVLDYNRISETDTFNTMATIGSGPRFANYDPKKATADEVAASESVFNYRSSVYELNVESKAFQSYESKFGPITHNGNQYTNVMRFNISNPRISSATDGLGLQITGLGPRSNFTQPFAASDIVLLLDGKCVSICPIFATSMAQQGKVQTVVIGGRPAKAPMQSIGGSRGSESYDLGTIWSYAQLFTKFATRQQAAVLAKLNDEVFQRLIDGYISYRDVLVPGQLGTGPGKQIGANFIKEDADCRIFNTRDMVFDQTKVWEKVADVTWKGKQCVVGKQ